VKQRANRGKLKMCSRLLKKKEIVADENRKMFSGKGKIGKIFHGMSKKFRNQGGNLK